MKRNHLRHNQTNYVDLPAEMLDGEESHKEYRYAVVDDKLIDAIFQRINK